MNIDDLKKKAKRRVKLEYDAWKELTGAERTALEYQTMLKILEDEDESTFKSRLMVARAVWENRLWGVSSDSFAAYLCEVGGRYQQADGKPSGVAYDLANYVSVVWDVLEGMGENPVTIASQAWSKTRLTVAAVRQNVLMLDEAGRETKSAERAVSTRVVNPDRIKDVVDLAKDANVTFRDMARDTYTTRVPQFGGSMSLRKDGMWDVSLTGLNEQQMTLVQKALRGHAELRIE